MPSTVFASRVFTATLAACTLSGCTESTVPRAGPVDASVTNDGGGPDVAYARESSAGFAAAESSLNNNSDASVSDAAPEAAPVLVGVDDWDPTQLDSYDEVALQSGLGELLRYGRGAAAVDVDGDGDDDIFVADGDNRWRGTWGSPEIFLNDGFGNFTRTDLGISDTDTTATWGGAFADFDNDGDPDLLIVSGGYSLPSTLVLFENCISDGDGFQDVTAKLGIAPDSGLSDLFEWWGASWADYDLDGYLDVIATRRNRGPALFHNNQGTGFTEVGASVGLTLEDDKDYKNPTWIDYDEDGDPDLYLAGSLAHAFYRNDSGLFMEVTDSVFTQGLIVPSRMSFAAAAADFDQDGHDDLYLGRWDYQDYVLFGDGAGGFEFVGAEGGLDAALAHNDNPSEPYENTMGLGIGDIHDDGYPDIVVGSGDPEETGPDIIYCNARDRSFFRCTDLFVETNDDHKQTRGHGAVFADFTGDGRNELYWSLGGAGRYDQELIDVDSREVDKFFVRRTAAFAPTAWLRLQGTISNRDAVGARVTVNSGGVIRHFGVRSTAAFQSQNSHRHVVPTFGVTEAIASILWPSGIRSEHKLHAGVHTLAIEPTQ